MLDKIERLVDKICFSVSRYKSSTSNHEYHDICIHEVTNIKKHTYNLDKNTKVTRISIKANNGQKSYDIALFQNRG